jgi:hypothetical protein
MINQILCDDCWELFVVWETEKGILSTPLSYTESRQLILPFLTLSYLSSHLRDTEH